VRLLLRMRDVLAEVKEIPLTRLLSPLKGRGRLSLYSVLPWLVAATKAF